MKKKSVILFSVSAALFVLFAVFTLITAVCDKAVVAYAENIEAELGFASVNQAIFTALGQNELWYELTEFLGVIALGVVAVFALLGLYQLITRKQLFAVDREILLLAVFYALVAFFYVFFEAVVINYRPILVDGALEASYPSSHAMLACSVFLSAPFAARHLVESRALRFAVCGLGTLLAVFTAVGRLLAGVHWLTDIIGALLLSATLVTLYVAALALLDEKAPRKHHHRHSHS
ncbi:MAG: phosphatase PAP2 family protein [Ruminococcaceae bacterium]|nr:phosphatase PAP2 family protein [Oscillospiraceae bacterium]